MSHPCNIEGSAWQAGNYSPVFSFLTAPVVGAESTVKIIAIADLGHTELDNSDEYDYDVRSLLAALAKLAAQMRPHSGDVK